MQKQKQNSQQSSLILQLLPLPLPLLLPTTTTTTTTPTTTTTTTLLPSLMVVFFPCGPWMSPFPSPCPPVLEKNLWESMFLRARCPSYHPTISVKSSKETQTTDPNQWPGLILSSSATRHLTDGAPLPLCQLFNASTTIRLAVIIITKTLTVRPLHIISSPSSMYVLCKYITQQKCMCQEVRVNWIARCTTFSPLQTTINIRQWINTQVSTSWTMQKISPID